MKKDEMLRSSITVSVVLLWCSTFASGLDYSSVLKSVARDIAALKRSYPQLKDFSSTKNVNLDDLVSSYQYRAHKSEVGGGWIAGVPNPDDDGVWFHIDFHDANSTAQIHTQPAMMSPNCIGDKRVSFLIGIPLHSAWYHAVWRRCRQPLISALPPSIEP